MYIPVLTSLFTVAMMLATSSALIAGDGPGIGQLTYTSAEVGTVIGRINAANGGYRGHGFAFLHRGYLIVPFSNDAGGGKGSGGFTVFDASNPKALTSRLTTYNNPAYGATSAHNATNIREAHAINVRGDIVAWGYQMTGAAGVEFWDFSNPLAPTKISQLALPGLTSGDYDDTPWWMSWQGRYLYVAGCGDGLYIVDAANPAAPVLANTGSNPNPIPTASLGGFRINVVWCVGNLMVLTNANNKPGLSTCDLSDPLRPALLWADRVNNVGYSVYVASDKLFACRNPARVYSLVDPSAPTVIGDGSATLSNGGYGMVQDGQFFYGSSSAWARMPFTGTTPFPMTTAAPSGFSGTPDWDFAQPLGNLVLASNDHGTGSALMPHTTLPDTTAPTVNMRSPRAGASAAPVTSRIGLVFSDMIQANTVNSSTLIIRPQGGQALPGLYAVHQGVVNFSPTSPLASGTTYEVVVVAGGIKDYAGNAAPASTATFSTAGGSSVVLNPTVSPSPALTGQAVTFSVSVAGASSITWNFDDGTPNGSGATVSHTYANPGHYQVVLSVTIGSAVTTRSIPLTVTRPLTASPPAQSSPLLRAADGRLWSVNTDAGTVAVLSADGQTRVAEIQVGNRPRTVGQAGSRIWVVNQGSDSISAIDQSTLSVAATISLPRGSRPYGVVVQGGRAFVSLQATGHVQAIDTSTFAMLGRCTTGPEPRALAIAGDGSVLLATRFISPATQGQVYVINPSTMALTRTIALAADPGPDTENSSRGIPNYLSGVAISPDGTSAWVAAAKANTGRGTTLDGLPLTFESTVRTIICRIDMASLAEVPAHRRDLDNADSATAVAFAPMGDWMAVSLQGSGAVDIVDATSFEVMARITGVGLAPQGLVWSADGSKLMVHNFMSRDVATYATSNLITSGSLNVPRLHAVGTQATEPLTASVLGGKRIFYNAVDRRMSRDGYISCASCHVEGGHDGRVWDFTSRGEGMRSTIDLRGHGGMDQGAVHWSANFDEIQDFENDIRLNFQGTGFMSDADFTATQSTLGTAKAGRSTDLDQLAAYVRSLTTIDPSPDRAADGSLTTSAVAGAQLFKRLDCASCHSGPHFMNSTVNPVSLFNVGTITTASGQRLGATLTGLDTPTLKGLWQTAPFLHDGSAADLAAVVAGGGSQHGRMNGLSATEQGQLVAYLRQIEDGTPNPGRSDPPTISVVATLAINRNGSASGIPVAVGDTETPAAALVVTAASSNTTLLPAAGIVLGGSAAQRTLSVTPATGQSGSAILTLTVNDGNRTTTAAVNVLVNAPPTFSTAAAASAPVLSLP